VRLEPRQFGKSQARRIWRGESSSSPASVEAQASSSSALGELEARLWPTAGRHHGQQSAKEEEK